MINKNHNLFYFLDFFTFFLMRFFIDKNIPLFFFSVVKNEFFYDEFCFIKMQLIDIFL